MSSKGFPEFDYQIIFENTGTAMAIIEEAKRKTGGTGLGLSITKA